jgi:hypothetical protein
MKTLKVSALPLILSIAFLTPAPAPAADAATGTGIGIILGDPGGFSLKLPRGPGNSLNFAIGYDLTGGRGPGPGNDAHLYVGGDYVWYNYSLIHVEKGRLPLYYGPGAYVSVGGESALGIRGVVGLEYQFSGAPFDLFIEIGPGINVIPDTRGGVFAGFGGRFFF